MQLALTTAVPKLILGGGLLPRVLPLFNRSQCKRCVPPCMLNSSVPCFPTARCCEGLLLAYWFSVSRMLRIGDIVQLFHELMWPSGTLPPGLGKKGKI